MRVAGDGVQHAGVHPEGQAGRGAGGATLSLNPPHLSLNPSLCP
jgi:hypothetical protein